MDETETVAGFSAPLPTPGELHVHEIVHMRSTTSTMDEAHARASRGAPAGTLILADEQTAGRGRSGNSWQSNAGLGVWMTLIERPTDAAAVDVLSIRLGLAIAGAVQKFANGPVRVKWPNDLYIGNRKLAGILVEARWREGAIDWVAIGVGINLRVPPDSTFAASLRDEVTRNDLLLEVLPALRKAASRHGLLSATELQRWMERDLTANRTVVAPVPGVVLGLERNGALRVQDKAGVIHELRTGSLVFAPGDAVSADSAFN